MMDPLDYILNKFDNDDLLSDISENEEDNKKEQFIQFDYNRQVNSLYIPTRLMTLINRYPNIYTDDEEL